MNKLQTPSFYSNLLFLFFIGQLSFAQKPIGFELRAVDSVFNFPSHVSANLAPQISFGGLSGITLFKNKLYVVSDKSFKTKEFHQSYLFSLDSTHKNIDNAFLFFGVKNAESIRFDTLTQKIFFTFERDDSTGVGYINESFKPVNLVVYSMETNEKTSANRGIESLFIEPMQHLWYSFESTEKAHLSFFKCPYDENLNNYNFKTSKEYLYPFTASSCLSDSQKPDSDLGNGVTEILGDAKGKLMVLERCFDGKHVSTKIFKASLSENSNIFTKELVFEFDKKNTFLAGKLLKPDNTEGMTWGKPEDGKNIIYVVTDDNFNPKYQRTLLLKLKEK
jgi:hypothetical protein